MKIKNILPILFLIIFTQCEKFAMDRRYKLKLKNNDKFPIVSYIGVNVNPLPAVYPDTTLNIDSIPTDTSVLFSGEEENLLDRSGKLDFIIKELPADTLSVYIFHLDTLKNNTWAEVRDGYKILKRYDLSLEDLEDLDYRLSYPPDAKMSGVKMYPPYP